MQHEVSHLWVFSHLAQGRCILHALNELHLLQRVIGWLCCFLHNLARGMDYHHRWLWSSSTRPLTLKQEGSSKEPVGTTPHIICCGLGTILYTNAVLVMLYVLGSKSCQIGVTAACFAQSM